MWKLERATRKERRKKGTGRAATLQQAVAQYKYATGHVPQPGPSSQPYPPHPSQLPPPPTWASIASQPPAPPAAAMGYFASRIGPQRRPLPDPPRDPRDGIYGPTFGKALKLAQRLGITPTAEVVKTLEVAEMACSTSDPCPQKKRKFHGQGFTIKDKGKGKEKAIDKEEVSLGYSSDKGLFGPEEVGEDPMNNEDIRKGHINDGMDFTVDGEISEMAGPDYRQVTFNLEITIANINQQLDNNITVVKKDNKYNCSPCSHECDHKETKE
jgi:hypothetical protein